MAAIKRNFLLPSGIGISAENLYLKSSAASTTYTTGALIVAGGVGIGGSLTINGDLTVSGTTFTVNSVTLTVDDKNIELGSVTSPSDITAEAGGITLKGATDKFINWYTGTGWSSNESLNLASGLVYKIANTSVISASSIGTGITNSSLTALGTITTGTWAGSTITARYGGTGITSYTVGDVLYANTTSTLARITAGTAGSVLASAGAGATPYYADPNVLVTSSSGATSRNVNVTSASTNSTHYLAFTPASGTVAGAALSNDTTFSFNPSTEILSVSGVAVTAGTASTNSATGALRVSGGLGVSGQLSFNTASLGSTGYSNPSIIFSGSAGSAPITLTVQSDNTLSWEGTSGQLFAIDNNLTSGDIFSVSDISGLPIINASAGQTVSINEFGGYTRIGNGTISSTGASNTNADGSLVVYGGVGITGNLSLGGVIRTGNNTFTKSGLGSGDIALDNGTIDTPSVLFYWANNRNIGIDTYYAGSGTTKFRIVRELNESGGAELWSVDRNGIVTQTAWDVGEVINTRVYNNTDLNMSATTTINSTTYTNVATITYTPKSSTSHLWIEFDAHYDFSNGTTTDDFFSRITVGGSAIVEKNQIMVGQVGGGTRSGTIFPISGRYTNTSTSGIAITVQAKWGSADDNIRVYGSSTSGYMRIQEIGR